MLLNLKLEHWESMRAHVDSCVPLEACGLLAGKNDSVQAVYLISNQAQSPVRFRMDPIEQLRAFDRIESAGWDLLAIFHSHPAGPETVSPTDILEATYNVVQIILSRSQGIWQMRGFWIDAGRVTEVELKIHE